MIRVTLPDGSPLELPENSTALDAAQKIGSRLAKAALAAKVNGATADLGATLSDGDRVRLAEIAAKLATMPDGEIVVAGHSDATPIGKTRYESNMHLSIVRALAVYHALVELKAVGGERISVAAYGEHRPVEGELQRLVEILFVPSAR